MAQLRGSAGGAGTCPKHTGLPGSTLGCTYPLSWHPMASLCCSSPVPRADVLMERSHVSSPNVSACVIDIVLRDRYLARGHVYLCAGMESEGTCQCAAWIA